MDEQNSMETSHNDCAVENSSHNSSGVAEVTTPDTKVTPEKRGRGSGRKRKSDSDMLAEAKATCGHEIDPSEGRQLRKRPDPPPKAEKKTPPRKPYVRKSKTPTNKEEEKETMVENDVKDHADGEKEVDGVKEDDTHTENDKQETNGDDTHEAAEDKVMDNGGTESADPAPTDAEVTPAPVEPAVKIPEKPVEPETEQKTEELERNAPTENVENSTENSV